VDAADAADGWALLLVVPLVFADEAGAAAAPGPLAGPNELSAAADAAAVPDDAPAPAVVPAGAPAAPAAEPPGADAPPDGGSASPICTSTIGSLIFSSQLEISSSGITCISYLFWQRIILLQYLFENKLEQAPGYLPKNSFLGCSAE